MIDLGFVWEQISEKSECLHDNVNILIGQKSENLIRAESCNDLNLDPLIRLEGHVLEKSKYIISRKLRLQSKEIP